MRRGKSKQASFCGGRYDMINCLSSVAAGTDLVYLATLARIIFRRLSHS
jgi:hypothetical protein